MSKAIRAIIADDEAPARAALKEELAHFPEVEIVAEAENGFTVIKAVHELKPDLLFLDIQMPRLNGFDVIELLGDEAPAVVFVTAYDEYALRAFEAKAIDYLLKPVRGERLAASLEKVKQILGHPDAVSQQHLVADQRDREAPLSRILVRIGAEVHLIPVKTISHFEAQDDYVRIHAAGKSFLKSERLNRLEQLLDQRQFCRIHRSFILNIEFLSKIEPWSKESRIAKLKTGLTLPISRDGYARLKSLLH
jgi:two-component system LytT family response regulator